MTSIAEIATYSPGQTRLRDRQHEFGLTDVELRRYERAFGYDRIAFDPRQSEADLLVGAASKLVTLRGAEQRVHYVLRPRTVRWPELHPDSALRTVRETFGLQHAQSFALVDQACAGGLLAIDMAGALLAQDGNPDALALVLIGEKASCRISQVIPGMAVLGEATVAILVSLDDEHDRVLGYAAVVEPIPGGGLTMEPDAVRAFGAVYGRTLGRVITGALQAARTRPEDLCLYLPHNVSQRLCLETGAAIGLAPEQVVTDTIGEIAHCWGADPFYNARHAIDLGRLRTGDRYLMTSVGMGATFAAMVVEH
ncbi:MAG: hypothetical protein L0H79_01555 [Intrasporangium sp.]|uniref:3-oxoacyl-[acyl-carrier-protein] synthase III C-terminal domain-containing protein n=1 Tax=Intrasporangium sp. TaxID=1925024 RepID=UPI00264912CA|nr:3-oxoacyl-[acyl-carrier-protein] synthase III C-terminal domain-containing protein [Intrasporangium sp.]MDN5794422.1 hypothetical protein [Intrasporangium sp.]